MKMKSQALLFLIGCVAPFTLALPISLHAAEDWKTSSENLPPIQVPLEGDWLVSSVPENAGLYKTSRQGELVLDNGLVRRSFWIGPNLACIGYQQLTSNTSLLRSIRPECRIGINGKSYDVGGLTGQPIHNFLRPEWFDGLKNDPNSFQFAGYATRPIQARFDWKPRAEWISSPTQWPPKGLELQFRFAPPKNSAADKIDGVEIIVHYEIYEGLPLISKWFTLNNNSPEKVTVTSFTSEILACTEASSQVEDLADPRHPNLHVETDFTTCSMQGESAQVDAVHWEADPAYPTQVNYLLKTECLLECRPPMGPNVEVDSGKNFESFRTWILALDSRDETRHALSLGRLYRTISPWVAENPLIFHVRSARPKDVRFAIDQASEVGFELVLMTFGSGFDIENETPEYLQQIKTLADEAHQKKIALGGYSLLASRSVSPKDDVINPKTNQPGGFARFGNSPCLESEWGQNYFRKLYQFYEATGCDVLEHDGSYPGDVCASHDHPGHRGLEDSRWKQWRTITDYYKWCRGRGIYLNVPDWYFLSGSSKNGMGYRETNWSLPRDYQEIIERQNIHDGTRYKLPSMGWMFVPLSEYHGGGAAATIEPLHEHLDHYQRRLQNLFGAGVQACFRGPRLYDTDETKAMVQESVKFYKDHRAILDSSLISLRRADGQDWDGWLHVNPSLPTCGLAVLYNPLKEPIQRRVSIPLYYTGLSKEAMVSIQGGKATRVVLDRKENAAIDITIPAQGMIYLEFTR